MQNTKLIIPIIIVLAFALVYLFSEKQSTDKAIESYLNDEEIDYGTVENIIAERESLNNTVWKDEVQAQKYEESIIALWDSIRISNDKFSQIKNFEFKNIFLPAFTERVSLERKIYKRVFSGEKIELNFEQWSQKISDWAGNYDLFHVEFHQKEFHPGNEDLSEYSFEFHIQSDKTRFILNGTCNVSWSQKLNLAGNHIPKSLNVENLVMLEYGGEDNFELTQLIGAEGDKSFTGFGVPIALMDLDQDYFSELIVIGANKVYPNNQGTFGSPQTLSNHFPNELITGSVFGDFTGNGFLDMICFGRNIFPMLFEGTGEISFNKKPRIIDSIIDPLIMPISATAADIDNDNDLDLWVTQYESPYIYGQMPTPYYDANDGYPSYLLINDGQGNFIDMTADYNLDIKRYRRTYSCSFINLNNDDYIDLITVNDFAGIDLYFNNNGITFTDVTQDIISEKSSFGMSHTVGDYNLDGLEDIFVTGMSSTTANRLEKMNLNRPGYEDQNSARSKMSYGNRMYIKQENGQYVEEQFPDMNQISKTGWSWGATTFDFDNDGDPDIYVTNGNMSKKTAKDYCTTYWRHDVYTGNSVSNDVLKDFFADLTYNIESEGISWNPFETNHLIMNINGKDFLKIGFLLGVALENDSRSIVSEDINNDGMVDLVVSTTRHHSYFIDGKFPDESIYIFKNNVKSATSNHWLGVILYPKAGGFHQAGTRITVSTTDNKNYSKTLLNGDSFRSLHSNKIHFGLGDSGTIKQLQVTWPNGTTETLENPETNNYYIFPLSTEHHQKLSLR